MTAFEAALDRARRRRPRLIGSDDFPGVPAVKTGDRWRFDTIAEGPRSSPGEWRERAYAIKVMQAIADAQREYASEDRDGTRPHLRAKFASGPGKRDGLY